MFYRLRAPWRKRCAPRCRRLAFESCEPRTLLAAVANHEPSGMDRTIPGALEDVPYVFGLPDFPFDDGDDGTQFLSGVRITTLPHAGSVTLTSDAGQFAIAPGQFISAADLVLGRLRFEANPNFNGKFRGRRFRF
jgi:hypothetical protein